MIDNLESNMKNYDLTLEQAVGKELAKEVKKVKTTKPIDRLTGTHQSVVDFCNMNEEEMRAYLTINNKEVNND